jgi:hypothetical protein
MPDGLRAKIKPETSRIQADHYTKSLFDLPHFNLFVTHIHVGKASRTDILNTSHEPAHPVCITYSDLTCALSYTLEYVWSLLKLQVQHKNTNDLFITTAAAATATL